MRLGNLGEQIMLKSELSLIDETKPRQAKRASKRHERLPD